MQKKLEREPIAVPHEVLEFIASNVTDNIRELEGALIRVTAYGSLNNQPLTRELAEHVLSDIVKAGQPRPITPAQILETTASTFGFSVDDLCGPSRRRPLVIARQIGMYLFRDLTDYSFPAIAREFGGRDHTTVMHAVEKITSPHGRAPADLRPGERPDRPDQERCMTLWGTGPSLWTHRPVAAVDGPAPSSAPSTARSVDNPLAGGQPSVGSDLDRRDVVHNPQPLLPSLPEFKFLVGKDPV